MHILSGPIDTMSDVVEAVDLNQTAGDIVILSAADSDLNCLVRANSKTSSKTPSLRLANLTKLGHNLSVDIYCEKIISSAKLIIIRLIGGVSYWPYGLEQIRNTARQAGAKLVVVPGDDKNDPQLTSYSNTSADVIDRIWAYFTNGGVGNAFNLLEYASTLIGYETKWKEPAPLLQAGLYWPSLEHPSIREFEKFWTCGRKVALITFYRALVISGNLKPIDSLIATLLDQNINPLPVYVSSLKDNYSDEFIDELSLMVDVGAVLNTTAFAVSSIGTHSRNRPFRNTDCPVFQVILSSSEKNTWFESSMGLGPRDIAMNVALPEVDGRLMSRAISFKSSSEYDAKSQCAIVTYEPVQDRILFVVKLVASWIKLKETPNRERRLAIILSNYPNKDSRIGNGVGLDTPASAVTILKALNNKGYLIKNLPKSSGSLMTKLRDGPTNNIECANKKEGQAKLSLTTYETFFQMLPKQIQVEVNQRWGFPAEDPFVKDEQFILPVNFFGNIVLGVQPARGYNINPKETYHDPALVPPHGYLAFYMWLKHSFKCDAVIHLGKHGNLEWLPGKSIALSETCYPEAILGGLPNIYPFIVNDPGEGTQAKRRSEAVIIDHLVPPLTRAESYGPLIQLENLIDEYFQASQTDPGRISILETEILEVAQRCKIFQDSGMENLKTSGDKLKKLDSYICDLKEMQIRDGLHIFGESPEGKLLDNLLVALVRVPRGEDEVCQNSILRTLVKDLRLGDFDPLDIEPAEEWTGPKPQVLSNFSPHRIWRTYGDTLERLEWLALELVSGRYDPKTYFPDTSKVLRELKSNIQQKVVACGKLEIAGVLDALEGKYIFPGPSGAPSRGRLDILPTGRNFYSVDTRTVPTPTAWKLGWKAAGLVIDQFRQENGEWPKNLLLSAWGTANMRTGGDDIAQVMAFLGVCPEWEPISGRVTGFKVIPYTALGRPRVDITLRISGFFRDAFPYQVELIDRAIQRVAGLDEPEEFNPLAALAAAEKLKLLSNGANIETASRRSTIRVFGSKPGAYGAGLQTLIDEGIWETKEDFARAYLKWGSFAYGSKLEGNTEEELFRSALSKVQVVLHNQDNREHDILDSDDYYQFHGGATAAVRQFSGIQPTVYHGDHSRPFAPKIRKLEEELGRVVRGRAVNPKWIAGVMRHGYKGAFEIAATVDYLFAFAATSGCVANHHFDAVYDAYIENQEVREFLKQTNIDAYKDIIQRLLEAQNRELWVPSRNSIADQLENYLETSTS